MPPTFKVLTATHDDGEKPKRFGCKAPTFDAWLEIYLQDDLPDPVIGILLNLNCEEVQDVKSRIRHELRVRAVTVSAFDVYYPPSSARSEILCRKGSPQLGWHLSPSKTTTLIRSSVVFARKEWTPNAFGCYALVLHQFRRDLLARLVDISGEELKKDKALRAGASDPKPYTRKIVANAEVMNNTASNKRPRVEPLSSKAIAALKREHVNLE
ncbi:hypothetical protein E4T47_00858 [Aureobasidium subglaciale]|nr:hypothetical protein E4T47_00858 [Aureobasidium subglaciale]